MIRGPHPAVVVRTDRMVRSMTVIVAPMTSAPRSAAENPRYLVPVSRREAGLPKDGYVKCDQLATFPTILLGRKVGRLNPEAIARLDDALRFGSVTRRPNEPLGGSSAGRGRSVRSPGARMSH